jgi:hypothetical protein
MKDETPTPDGLEDRWPKDGDRLFTESTWGYDARIVTDPGERFYRLPMGYKRAGDILIAQAASNAADRRNIIYAALFCYRQSIELFLKRLVDEFGGGHAYSPKNTHDLRLLWERCMTLFDERGSENSLGIDAVRILVDEMDEADKKSDGFRFPSGHDGSPFGFGDRGIDLDNIRTVMEGLENFFECAYLAFSGQDDAASDNSGNSY